MKKYIFISLTLITILASGCGNLNRKKDSISLLQTSDTGTAKIYFNDYQHDFGNIAEGKKAEYNFKFQNKGTGTLVILSASTTCGCTVSKYSTNPIPAGGEGELEVIFDTSGRSGTQTKIITVKSNASIPEVLLKITADVVAEN